MASSSINSTPIMSASTASFCARSTSSTLASIFARYSVISSICFCMAYWAMMPPTPASIAGFVSIAPGFATNCRFFANCPLAPRVVACTNWPPERCTRFALCAALADSSVSFIHRPALAETSDAVWSPAPPLATADGRRRRSSTCDGCPVDAAKRSTAVGLPKTTRPSPSLMSWISVSGSSAEVSWGSNSVVIVRLSLGSCAVASVRELERQGRVGLDARHDARIEHDGLIFEQRPEAVDVLGHGFVG